MLTARDDDGGAAVTLDVAVDEDAVTVGRGWEDEDPLIRSWGGRPIRDAR